MNPLNVYCSACLAVPSEPCTTMSGCKRSHHAPRAQLADHPDPCTSCGAVYGEPCLKVSGAMSMFPHRSRLRSTRVGAEVTWTK